MTGDDRGNPGVMSSRRLTWPGPTGHPTVHLVEPIGSSDILILRDDRGGYPGVAPPRGPINTLAKTLATRACSGAERLGDGTLSPAGGRLQYNAERRRVGEMADAPALGAGGRKAVWVRVPCPAPNSKKPHVHHLFCEPKPTLSHFCHMIFWIPIRSAEAIGGKRQL